MLLHLCRGRLCDRLLFSIDMSLTGHEQESLTHDIGRLPEPAIAFGISLRWYKKNRTAEPIAEFNASSLIHIFVSSATIMRIPLHPSSVASCSHPWQRA